MIHRTNFFVSQDAALRWYGALDDPAIAVRDKIASIGAANGARSRPEWRGVGTVASRCALICSGVKPGTREFLAVPKVLSPRRHLFLRAFDADQTAPSSSRGRMPIWIGIVTSPLGGKLFGSLRSRAR
jgi:hypothetical protein